MPRKFGDDGTCLRCFQTSCECGGTQTDEDTGTIDDKPRWLRICDCCGAAEPKPSTNNNCLRGFRCFRCGAQENFDIVVTATFNYSDDGNECVGGDNWDDDSYCECRNCGIGGKVKDFCHLEEVEAEQIDDSSR